MNSNLPSSKQVSVLVLGVGAFARSTTQILKEDGANVATYLTRNYGHYPPSLSGPTYDHRQLAAPTSLLESRAVDLIVPMSIDWAQQPWKSDLEASRARIFCPTGEGMRIERERDFARELCATYKVPFPEAHFVRTRSEAERLLQERAQPFVIKNPLCSPTSPIHTILCESVEDTRSWLGQVNDAEGIFLQRYLGRREVGHIAFVSGGAIYSLVTNQEYKRAFAGNMGIIAGAPLGGLIEIDLHDKYGLARELLHPLLPWFREVNYHGPVQVTAVRYQDQWHVIEYNIRIGVTSGAMILRLLRHPTDTLLRVARNEALHIEFRAGLSFGCSVTLAGYGYPYVQIAGPSLPIETDGDFDCDVWWNEVGLGSNGKLHTTGHRIADVIAFGNTLDEAIAGAYRNIRKIQSLGSYFRPDVGRSLWPPGNL